jgi:hypothetical protein
MDEKFKVDADTMNALVNGLATVVFAIARQLSATQREAFAKDLARLAQNAERDGDSTLETLLLDLHRASMAAPP